MNDPLTEQEKAEFILNFAANWRKTYQDLLSSGCLDEESGSYIPAKFALILAAEEYKPFTADYKKALANARHFV